MNALEDNSFNAISKEKTFLTFIYLYSFTCMIYNI